MNKDRKGLFRFKLFIIISSGNTGKASPLCRKQFCIQSTEEKIHVSTLQNTRLSTQFAYNEFILTVPCGSHQARPTEKLQFLKFWTINSAKGELNGNRENLLCLHLNLSFYISWPCISIFSLLQRSIHKFAFCYSHR